MTEPTYSVEGNELVVTSVKEERIKLERIEEAIRNLEVRLLEVQTELNNWRALRDQYAARANP